MGLSTLDVTLCTIFGFLTIMLAGIIILTYTSSKDLQQHPSGLIAVLSVFEIMMAYHNIIYAHGTERISTPKVRQRSRTESQRRTSKEVTSRHQ